MSAAIESDETDRRTKRQSPCGDAESLRDQLEKSESEPESTTNVARSGSDGRKRVDLIGRSDEEEDGDASVVDECYASSSLSVVEDPFKPVLPFIGPVSADSLTWGTFATHRVVMDGGVPMLVFGFSIDAAEVTNKKRGDFYNMISFPPSEEGEEYRFDCDDGKGNAYKSIVIHLTDAKLALPFCLLVTIAGNEHQKVTRKEMLTALLMVLNYPVRGAIHKAMVDFVAELGMQERYRTAVQPWATGAEGLALVEKKRLNIVQASIDSGTTRLSHYLGSYTQFDSLMNMETERGKWCIDYANLLKRPEFMPLYEFVTQQNLDMALFYDS